MSNFAERFIFAPLRTALYAPLKRVLLFFLKRSLGPFLTRDLDMEQLDFGIKQGFLELRDLELNVASLNEQVFEKLPVRLVRGFIRLVNVKIPYSILTTPCTLLVEGVDIVVATKSTPSVTRSTTALLQRASTLVHSLPVSSLLASSDELKTALVRLAERDSGSSKGNNNNNNNSGEAGVDAGSRGTSELQQLVEALVRRSLQSALSGGSSGGGKLEEELKLEIQRHESALKALWGVVASSAAAGVAGAGGGGGGGAGADAIASPSVTSSLASTASSYPPSADASPSFGAASASAAASAPGAGAGGGGMLPSLLSLPAAQLGALEQEVAAARQQERTLLQQAGSSEQGIQTLASMVEQVVTRAVVTIGHIRYVRMHVLLWIYACLYAHMHACMHACMCV